MDMDEQEARKQALMKLMQDQDPGMRPLGVSEDDLRDGVKAIGDNMKHGSDTFQANMDQMQDRMKMADHPEKAGPRLPSGPTPQEKEYYDQLSGAMMGSIAPVPAMRFGKIGGLLQSGAAGMEGKAAASKALLDSISQDALKSGVPGAADRALAAHNRYMQQLLNMRNKIKK